jgi:hypothetical protein
MVVPFRAEIRRWLEGIAGAETSELRFPEIRFQEKDRDCDFDANPS